MDRNGQQGFRLRTANKNIGNKNYHIAPSILGHYYVNDLVKASIGGVKETALQIIKERR